LGLISALIGGLGVAGCGSRFPETVAVSGRITLDGGDWPAEGEIRFLPVAVDEGRPRRPGSGKFDPSGRFTVKSWEEKAGLVPGTYRVSVECWKVPPTQMGGMAGPAPVSYVPAAYQAPGTTPLEVVVPRDKDSLELLLDVKSH
jgi:hypothetical protein